MAFSHVFYHTTLPKDVAKIIRDDLLKFDENLVESLVGAGGPEANPIKDIRKAKNSWIPATHWSAGFIMHYVNLVNKDNFGYDIVGIQGDIMQYTVYDEGEFYTWHQDEGIESLYKPSADGPNSGNSEARISDYVNSNTQLIRKLSFSLQLSDPSEYEGGQFQLIDDTGKSFVAPKEQGTLIIFDSRLRHRVRKIKSGCRKSIVGWVVGPKWR